MSQNINNQQNHHNRGNFYPQASANNNNKYYPMPYFSHPQQLSPNGYYYQAPQQPYYHPTPNYPNYYYQQPIDPRKRNNNKIVCNQGEIKKQVASNLQKKCEQQNKKRKPSSSSEDQEQQYTVHKRKLIKKHPVLDSPEQIKKWIEARKKNYPKLTNIDKKKQEQSLSNQMSILQTKIRKRLQIINANPKTILKKVKCMDILKRIIQNPSKFRPIKLKKRSNRLTRIFAEEKQQKFQKQEKIEKQQNQNNSQPQQVPIQKINPIKQERYQVKQHKSYTVQQIISHLQSKQREDNELVDTLLQYKSNSLNYKYSCSLLETNFILQDVFKQSSYILQAIRFIVRSNFFQKTEQIQKQFVNQKSPISEEPQNSQSNSSGQQML